MNVHVNNKVIAAYISGTLHPDAHNSVSQHLQVCDRCRSAFQRLDEALSPSLGQMTPSEAVRNRVIDSWKKIQSGKLPSDARSFREFLLSHKSATITAIAATIVAAIATAIIVMRPPAAQYLKIVSVVDGTTVNGVKARTDLPIGSNSTIRMPEKTMMALAYNGELSIIIIGPAQCTVEKFNKGSVASESELVCTFTQGIMWANTGRKKPPFSYHYKTPSALVEPVGTEFIMKATDNKTIVIVNNGGAFIRMSERDTGTLVTEGNRCIVGKTLKITPSQHNDFEIFNAIGVLRTGDYTISDIDRIRVLLEEGQAVHNGPTKAGLRDPDKMKEGSRAELNKGRNTEKEKIRIDGEPDRNNTLQKNRDKFKEKQDFIRENRKLRRDNMMERKYRNRK